MMMIRKELMRRKRLKNKFCKRRHNQEVNILITIFLMSDLF
jgi:hypothetical protein